MVSGFLLIASVGLWGMSFVLPWQAGYGHSRPTCNHEAQQGSVKLNFLLGLRLLTSTEGSVNLHHRSLSIWFCNTQEVCVCVGGGGCGVGISVALIICLLELDQLKRLQCFKAIYFKIRRLHRLDQAPASPSIVWGITVILCTNRLGRLDTM